jgi:hypothetical protein
MSVNVETRAINDSRDTPPTAGAENQFLRSQGRTGNVAVPPYLRVCANQDQAPNSDSRQKARKRKSVWR